MTRHLVAADADQIQNLLLRSSHLREVIGGSMLLTRFCQGVKQELRTDAIISAGGNFRLAFDSPEQARQFKESLAEDFRAQSGGTLTTAGPLAYEPVQFEPANRQLQQDLRLAKLSRSGEEAVAHMPFMALCASCGVELATRHATPTPELPLDRQERPIYLCATCNAKALERRDDRPGFFDDFRSAIGAMHPDLKPLRNPGDPAEAVGKFDWSRYVGYILADGNGMGKLFDQCRSEEALADLSQALDRALWAGLAEPINHLLERLDERKQKPNWMPIVPLIVGGDDLLALVPARYALDIARRIGEQFERSLNAGATIALSVIICQNHYPYSLAYERGKHLLKASKRIGKAFGLSTVTFEVIKGNALADGDEEGQGSRPRSTLKPYVIGAPEKIAAAETRGFLPLSVALDQRLALKNLPGKRLNELRRLFDQVNAHDYDPERWQSNLQALRHRIDREELGAGLAALGVETARHGDTIWRSVLLPYKTDPHLAHGMPDVIEAWDYAYQLHVPDQLYRPEAE